MKRTLFAALLLAGLALAPALMAKPVKVVMKDGSIINGDMLGMDEGLLTLETSGGKSKEIKLDKIKKVFDSDGKSIPLTGSTATASGGASEAASAEESVEEEAPAPKPKAKKAKARKSGAKTAGNIMAWSGLGVGLVGVCVWAYGYGEMSSATTKGYTAPYQSYVYYIDGAYYTYAQYYRYTTGQGYAYTGAAVSLVGFGVGLAGAIIAGSASKNQEASLLDIQDGQLAWGVPDVQLAPDLSSRVTLLTAEF